jgi:hypothetical protein
LTVELADYTLRVTFFAGSWIKSAESLEGHAPFGLSLARPVWELKIVEVSPSSPGTIRRQQLLFPVTGNDFEVAMRKTLAIGSKIHLLLILLLRSQ